MMHVPCRCWGLLLFPGEHSTNSDLPAFGTSSPAHFLELVLLFPVLFLLVERVDLRRCMVHGKESFMYCRTCKRVVCSKCERCGMKRHNG